MSAARHDAGYTLLEMIVALVVFGLIMAGIAQTFRFGLTAWTASMRNTVRPEALAAMDAALTRMIAQARPDSMVGGADRLAFTTTLPAGAGLQSGLADAAILLAPGGNLVLRYGPHLPGVALVPQPATKTEPLTPGVAALRLSYLAAQSGGVPAWSSNWSGSGLPLLVKIHLQFADGQSWPDLVATPTDAGN